MLRIGCQALITQAEDIIADRTQHVRHLKRLGFILSWVDMVGAVGKIPALLSFEYLCDLCSALVNSAFHPSGGKLTCGWLVSRPGGVKDSHSFNTFETEDKRLVTCLIDILLVAGVKTKFNPEIWDLDFSSLFLYQKLHFGLNRKIINSTPKKKKKNKHKKKLK